MSVSLFESNVSSRRPQDILAEVNGVPLNDSLMYREQMEELFGRFGRGAKINFPFY